MTTLFSNGRNSCGQNEDQSRQIQGGCRSPPNMRMHLPKPRAPFSKAEQVDSASSQVIRGR
jgi:hypothetical protein